MTHMIVRENITLNTEVLSGITFGFQFSRKTLADHPSLHYLHRMDMTKVDEQQLIETVVQKSYDPK